MMVEQDRHQNVVLPLLARVNTRTYDYLLAATTRFVVVRNGILNFTQCFLFGSCEFREPFRDSK